MTKQNTDTQAGKQASEAALPDWNSAYATVFHTTHREAFLNKMAELGLPPQTEKQAQQLLELGGKVAAYRAQNPRQDKSASLFDQASDELDQLLQGGSNKSASDAQLDSAYERAYRWAQDPRVYKSAVVLRYGQEQGHAPQQQQNTN